MTASKYLFLFVLGLCIGGCTPFHMTLTNEERSYPATSAEKIQLFFQGETTPPAKELGVLVVSGDSEKQGVKFMQEKAATMGADAIINLEVKIQTQTLLIIFIPIPVHSYFVSGTAVKYVN
ncbi:MAG: hypothetical protein EHM64_13695 [Ignavibacteriae bacterium]|nr:MAG: hypothetical protein EHM64_13695 [Ignavibacteriota bacterium]